MIGASYLDESQAEIALVDYSNELRVPDAERIVGRSV